MPEKIARISRPLAWRNDFIRAHDYRCHYCNRFAPSVDTGPDVRPWHVDHMEALAAGGEDVEENLTLACERCNSYKHTLPYEHFRRYAGIAFWVADKPRRIRDVELESLATSYSRTTDGTWLYRRLGENERPEYTCELRAHGEHELGDDADTVIGELLDNGGRTGGMHNIRFIIQAHRLMPKLLAEVHLLRAELAEARGEQDDTALDTSVA
jgi:hypothetical protein